MDTHTLTQISAKLIRRHEQDDETPHIESFVAWGGGYVVLYGTATKKTLSYRVAFFYYGEDMLLQEAFNMLVTEGNLKKEK